MLPFPHLIGGVGVRGHYQLCAVFEAKELMMPEEGAIPPRLLQANVPEALEYELVDGLGHFVSFLEIKTAQGFYANVS